MAYVIWHISHVFFYKVLMLVGGGSVINMATPSRFYAHPDYTYRADWPAPWFWRIAGLSAPSCRTWRGGGSWQPCLGQPAWPGWPVWSAGRCLVLKEVGRGPADQDAQSPETLGICFICICSRTRAGNQCFLSELLVYLKNCPQRLVLLFLTMVWNPKFYNLEWKEVIWSFW